MKIGLVLEGDKHKYSYTAGVLDVLLNNNININECIASSQGALFFLNSLSKEDPITFTLVKEKNIYKKIIQEYSLKNYLKSNINFYVPITNVITGDIEYFKITNPTKEIDSLKASCSIPILSKVIKIHNHKYISGDIKAKIPLRRALELEYDKIIVVLTENYNYKMKKKNNILTNIKYRCYPNLLNLINSQHITYNDTQEFTKRLEQEGKIFVIKPSKDIKVNKIIKNPVEQEELYKLGIKDGIDIIKKLKKYLNS